MTMYDCRLLHICSDTITRLLGAIFFHQGITYLVKELNVDKKYAIVVATNVDWHTRQRYLVDN